MKRLITTFGIVIILIFSMSDLCIAQRVWKWDGVPISTAGGNQGAFGKPGAAVTVIPNPTCSTCPYRAVVAWHDDRDDAGDIYTQSFDVSGNRLWIAAGSDSNGIVVCDKSNDQRLPKIIACDINDSLTGDVIIAWEDERGTNKDIYAQKLNKDGEWQWADASGDSNGIPVCTTSADQRWVKLCSDEANGAILAWNDYRNASGDPDAYVDIYAARVDSDGTVLETGGWALNGRAVCTEDSTQWLNHNAICSDNKGGAILGWVDYRANAGGKAMKHVLSNSDIYAMRIRHDGWFQAGWDSTGLVVCNQGDKQSWKGPQVCSDGDSGAYFIWGDRRDYDNFDWDVYSMRIEGDASSDWIDDGKPVTQDLGPQGLAEEEDPGSLEDDTLKADDEETIFIALASDGKPIAAFSTWREVVIEGDTVVISDIYSQRQKDTDGDAYWGVIDGGEDPDTIQGLAISTQDANTWFPRIAADEEGGAYIVYHDRRSGGVADIYCQHVDSSSVTLWKDDGYGVCTADSDQAGPEIIKDNNADAVYIVFSDRRKVDCGDKDIYAQRLEPAQMVSDAYEDQHLAGQDFVALKDGDYIYSTWCQTKTNNNKILFDKAERTAGWDDWGTDVRVDNGTLSDERIDPSIATYTDQSGTNVYVTWIDYEDETTGELYFNKSTNGGEDWSSDYCIVDAESVNDDPVYEPSIAVDNAGDNILVAFCAEKTLYYVYGDSPFDDATDWSDPAELIDTSNDCYSPCIVGTNGIDFGVIWVEKISSTLRIRMGKTDLEGNSSWPISGPVSISDNSNTDYDNPSLMYLPSKGGHSASWYATFLGEDQSDDWQVYLDRCDVGGSWTTDSLVTETGYDHRCPSIAGVRIQGLLPNPDHWADCILLSYDKERPDGNEWEIFAHAKVWNFNNSTYINKGPNLIPSTTDTSFCQVLPLHAGQKKAGVLWRYYEDGDAGGEGVYWNMTQFD